MQAITSHATDMSPDGQPNHRPRSTRVTVIGIGNTLMGDDGVGVHIVESLQQRLHDRFNPDQVRLLDGGTLSFTLLDEVEQTDYLIVADAAEFQAEPGTLRLLEQAEMDAYLGSTVRPSVHEVNLLDVLTAARLRNSMPARYALVGIQPEHIGWSTRPSKTVAPSVQQAADMIESLIAAALEAAGAEEPPA